MNTPNESSTVLAGSVRADVMSTGHETTAEAIEDHARVVLTHAHALVELTRECNDDEITKVCETIVLELAAIVRLQDLELEEILPTETCTDCNRPSLDFGRSKTTGKVTCRGCLDQEAESTLEEQLRASLRDDERNTDGGQDHESGSTLAESARELHALHELHASAISPEASPRHTRASVLDIAKEATLQQREAHYGTPSQNFARVGAMWSAILGGVITPAEVALCLAALKIARAVEDPTHGDNWVDLAGYAACGGEVALARRSA